MPDTLEQLAADVLRTERRALGLFDGVQPGEAVSPQPSAFSQTAPAGLSPTVSEDPLATIARLVAQARAGPVAPGLSPTTSVQPAVGLQPTAGVPRRLAPGVERPATARIGANGRAVRGLRPPAGLQPAVPVSFVDRAIQEVLRAGGQPESERTLLGAERTVPSALPEVGPPPGPNRPLPAPPNPEAMTTINTQRAEIAEAATAETRRKQAQLFQLPVPPIIPTEPIGADGVTVSQVAGVDRAAETPSLGEQFIHPGWQRVRDLYHAKGRFNLLGDAKRILDAEVQFRLQSGLYNEDEVTVQPFEAWLATTPPKIQAAIRVDPAWFRFAGTQYVLVERLRENIHDELRSGMPMYAPENAPAQEALYKRMVEIGPKELPPAKGFFDKLARFGGEMSVFLAEYAVLRQAVRPGIRAVTRTPALTTAGRAPGVFRRPGGVTGAAAFEAPATAGVTAGLIAAAEGEDPARAAATLGALPAAGGIARAVLPGVRPGLASGIGTGVTFGGMTAAEGGGLEEILISGVVAPLLFHAGDLIRFPFRPRGLAAPKGERIEPEAWRGWTSDASRVKRLVHRFNTFQEQLSQGRSEATVFAQNELRNLGEAIQREAARSTRFPPRYSGTERAILAEFSRQYQPQAVRQRTAEQRKEPTRAVETPATRAQAPAEPPVRGVAAPAEQAGLQAEIRKSGKDRGGPGLGRSPQTPPAVTPPQPVGPRFVVEPVEGPTPGWRVRDKVTNEVIQSVGNETVAGVIRDEYNNIEDLVGRSTAPLPAPPAGEKPVLAPTIDVPPGEPELPAVPETVIPKGRKSVNVPAVGNVPPFQISRLPNEAYFLRFRRRAPQDVLERFKAQGIRWDGKARAWLVPARFSPTQIRAITQGAPLPHGPPPPPGVPTTVPSPPTSAVPPDRAGPGFTRGLSPKDIELILGMDPKGTKPIVIATLTRRGYRHSIGKRYEYLIHPTGEWRYKLQKTNLRTELRAPEGRGFVPLREREKPLTYKRFAESIQKQLGEIAVSTQPSAVSQEKPRAAPAGAEVSRTPEPSPVGAGLPTPPAAPKSVIKHHKAPESAAPGAAPQKRPGFEVVDRSTDVVHSIAGNRNSAEIQARELNKGRKEPVFVVRDTATGEVTDPPPATVAPTVVSTVAPTPGPPAKVPAPTTPEAQPRYEVVNRQTGKVLANPHISHMGAQQHADRLNKGKKDRPYTFRLAGKMDRNRPKFEAIVAAIKAKRPIESRTYLRTTPLRNPDHIRLTAGGNVQVREGRQWVTLLDPQIDRLVAQAGGLPRPAPTKAPKEPPPSPVVAPTPRKASHVARTKQEPANAVKPPAHVATPATKPQEVARVARAAEALERPDLAIDPTGSAPPDVSRDAANRSARQQERIDRAILTAVAVAKPFDGIEMDVTKARQVLGKLAEASVFKLGLEVEPPVYRRVRRAAEEVIRWGTVAIPVPGSPNATFYAVPGKEAEVRALAAKAGAIKPQTKKASPATFKAKKPSNPLPRQRPLSRMDRLVALGQAVSREPTRYSLDKMLVLDSEAVVTDGRRLWIQEGDFSDLAKGGPSLYGIRPSGISVGPTGLTGSGLEGFVHEKGSFPAYKATVPDKTPGSFLVDIASTYDRLRQAQTVLTNLELRGVIAYRNPDDTLGVFAYDKDTGQQAEVNLLPGGTVLGAVDVDFLMEQLRWHWRGSDTSVLVTWESPKTALRTDGSGKTGVLMPVSMGGAGGRAVKAATPGLHLSDLTAAVNDLPYGPEQAKEAGLTAAFLDSETGKTYSAKDQTHRLDLVPREKWLLSEEAGPTAVDSIIRPGWITAGGEFVPREEGWVRVAATLDIEGLERAAGLKIHRTTFEADSAGDRQALGDLVDALDHLVGIKNEPATAGLEPAARASLNRLSAEFNKQTGREGGPAIILADVDRRPVEANALRMLRMRLAHREVAKLHKSGKLPKQTPGTRSLQEWTPEELAYIRAHDPTKPAFGIGAAANIPDTRTWNARVYDSISQRIIHAPPGTIRERTFTFVGRGMWGPRWALTDKEQRAFRKVRGAKSFAEFKGASVRNAIQHAVAEESAGRLKEINRINRKLREPEDQKISAEELAKIRAKYHRELEDLFRGDKPLATASQRERELFRLYSKPIDEVTAFILNEPWTWPHLRGFGLHNVEQVIAIRAMGPGTYLRRLYEASLPLGRVPVGEVKEGKKQETVSQAVKQEHILGTPHETLSQAYGAIFGGPRERLARAVGTVLPLPFDIRSVGPRIRGGMFMPKRGDEAFFTVVDATTKPTTYIQFSDEAQSVAVWNRLIDAKKAEFGARVFRMIRIVDPFSVDELEAEGLVVPIRDMEILVTRTLIDSLVNLETLKLFQFLRDTVAVDSHPDPDNPETYKLMPDQPAFGPLRNTYVPQRIAYALSEWELIRTSFWSKLWHGYNNAFKSSKVVWSPSTWGRNLMGIVAFEFLDGMNPIRDAKWLNMAANEFKAQGANWELLVRENVITQGFFASERREFARLVEADPGNWPKSVRTFVDNHPEMVALARKTATKVGEINSRLGRVYDLPDQVAKLASYLKKTQGDGLTHEEAVRLVNRAYPNYDEPGGLAKWSRRSPFGAPFVMFTDQAAKIALGAFRDRLLRLFVLTGSVGLLTYVSRMLTGMGDAEWELVNQDPRRKNFPQRYFQPLLPWRDSDDKAAFYDLRWVFPLASETNVVSPMGGLTLPFVFQQPFFTASQEVRFNQDDYVGRELSKEDDVLRVRAWKWAVHVMKSTAPTPPLVAKGGGGGIQRIYNAATGEAHESVSRAVLREGFGISARDPWIPRDRAYKLLVRRLGAGEAKRFAELLTLYNSLYRSDHDKRIGRGRVKQSVLLKRRNRILDSRRIP